MKLYHKQGACSLSPLIVLCESGLDFSLVHVDLATKKTQNGEDYLQINPKGQVPALQISEQTVLTEGVAIVQYIADQVPERHLLAPVNCLKRYRTLEWLNYISTELHKGIAPLFNKATPESYRQIARQNYEQKLRWVDKQLSDKRWLLDETFTVADAYLFTVLRWSPHLGLSLNTWPALSAYLDRVAQRPAVQKALEQDKQH